MFSRFMLKTSQDCKKISEHPDIYATTHLGPPNLYINNSRSLANRYGIDKEDTELLNLLYCKDGACPFVISLIINSY